MEVISKSQGGKGPSIRLIETLVGITLFILSIIFYRFPATYLWADILAIIAALICGREMVVGAVRGIWAGKFNVAELITLAIIASFIIGEYLVAAEVALIMTLGGYLEERVIDRSQKSIHQLAALIPRKARLTIKGEEKMVPLENIFPGDLVLVKPGEEIPVDGVVEGGNSLVSEGSITGENKPLGKSPGERVFAGSMNLEGALTIKTTQVGRESTLGRMVELTRQALADRPPVIRLVDRFATWFTPAVLTLAFLVYLFSGDLIRAITVLVIMCPCTLVLAIPSALAASLGKSVKNGILPKGGVYLEKVSQVDTVILDKTGTLTFGTPSVVNLVPLNGVSKEELLTRAAVAEKHSSHPLARAIMEEARARNLTVPDPDKVTNLPGQGVAVISQEEEILVKSTRFLKDHLYQPRELILKAALKEEELGRTTFFVAHKGQVLGIISLEDILREDALDSIASLKKIVPRLILLTGDNFPTAYRVAREMGIKEFNAQLLPQGKVQVLKELKEQGRTVAAVGDGINDAPLLAAADVGIVMGDTATSLTLDAGSVVLLKGDLSKLPLFFQIAHKTKRIIKENIIVFAIIYNLAAFFLASFGYLSPLGGAIVHNIGSTAVVLNSMRLVR
ncbi:MAG: cation-translocating P-type ATPase [Candidatus Syntrophonatronum acetioxidans]|uniref:Cd(2+)-exporting ATPase n=1 Tax=Candidatus Syntrophonatronum acetioxidans TaxID=1795816 RepID=A0A424YHX5_9FIRM|nr:MAG: cation-translocating P-type ATPase [Candidatus Syntrophonatronum acetioxidans]